jgi:hypothetical protein
MQGNGSERGRFLFGDFLKSTQNVIFLPKNLVMSDKSSTFALEIGKVLINHFTGESRTSNAGVRLGRNTPVKNTYRKRAEETSDYHSDFW